MATGTPEEVAAVAESYTGRFLRRGCSRRARRKPQAAQAGAAPRRSPRAA